MAYYQEYDCRIPQSSMLAFLGGILTSFLVLITADNRKLGYFEKIMAIPAKIGYYLQIGFGLLIGIFSFVALTLFTMSFFCKIKENNCSR